MTVMRLHPSITRESLAWTIAAALAVVAATSAAIHSLGRSKLALALGGAVGLFASLGALFVGMLLRTGA